MTDWILAGGVLLIIIGGIIMWRKLMATLQEARDAVLTAVADAKATMERTTAAILSAINDLQAGADTAAIAESLSAAATDLTTSASGLGTAADSLTAADPTP